MLLDSPLGGRSGEWAGLLPAVALEKAGLWVDLGDNQQTAEMCGRLVRGGAGSGGRERC